MTAGEPCWVEVDVGADPEASKAFYARVLGWSYGDDTAAEHHHTVARANGRAVAALGTPGATASPSWTVYFAVDDADATADAAEELGAMLLHGPEDDGRGGRLFVALDTGGATFGGWESDAPAGLLADEHGAPCWVEAASAEPGQSRGFYERLFGYAYTTPSDDAPEYRTFRVDAGPGAGPGADAPTGAITFAGDALPHWLVYFAVDDLDAALDAVRSAGGTVVREDGSRAVVADPCDARLGLRARSR